ncbi:MAG: hypothetical protein K0R50_929 [Eubacterium sp.]|jgi:hypothetical protein|nr:hypothetical protein [Eubacterium sp.]
MNINQKSLNDLLSIMQPKNSLDMLREKREAQLKKINQGLSTSPDSGKNDTNDSRQDFAELRAIDEQIQMEIYEEKSNKLELERLEREAAAAKSLRKKERASAEHQAVLERCSMNKLFSANRKSIELRTMVKSGVSVTLTKDFSASDKDGPVNKLFQKSEEINRDLRESSDFGIAAAKVAARRQNIRNQKENEEAALENSKRRKNKNKNKKHINIIL